MQMTEAEVDEVMRLKAVGFGAWSRDDIASVVDLEWDHPHVLDWLAPGQPARTE